MTKAKLAGVYPLGDVSVTRMGYGAMQLAGPHVFGPPADRQSALAVLREVVESGITHLDTSDFYGPHVTNQLIREALHPYKEDLVIVTKVGARRGANASWEPAFSPHELESAVYDNLRHLDLDVLDVVNLRLMFNTAGPVEGDIEEPLTALAQLQHKGLIRHIGLSNATARQVAQARSLTPIVCVQNLYNLAHRGDDDLIDHLARAGVAYVPFFPLGGFTPLQSSALNAVAERYNAKPLQVALAWLLQRSPNILLIPGTSSPAHLRQNIASVDMTLDPEAIDALNNIAAAGDPL
ncbi:aldo/keto reductase family oxidoreductase [Martelella alba]|uniref:Aldo/keto reductase family oxidoreductase n=1 Tax=Martelella alba TaxID=2590451 RepID=A0ABY2SNK3_9HYPH|nr:aldo/keto reductase family oxidoreductase [Martelella alba]TKI06075.1 aldo/keto reductase family oxidoreductase [Martelella alba]